MQIAVRPGDTLWGYSVMFDVPLQLILDSNPTLGSVLQVGDLINIPGYTWNEYTVVAGDTLWQIAKRNNISLHLLLQSNPTLETEQLQIGTKIVLPSRVTSRVINGEKNYTYEQLLQDIETLRKIYPNLSAHTIGKSVMGRDIIELRVGNGPTEIHVNASIHANEWITTGALMTFINDFLLATTNSQQLEGQYMFPLYTMNTMSFVPMVNPDGVNLVINGAPYEEPYHSEVLRINGGSNDFSGWKANIRGVDLNKQFPALWEVDAVKGPQEPAPRDFSGTAPLTEPEVQAIAQLTRERSFNRVLALHTQGEEIYWGFQGLEPPESEVYANRMSQASGYQAIRYVNSTAGYKDWFIQDWRRPGFTIELGLGQNPLPLSQFPSISRAANVIIIEAMKSAYS